MKDSRHYYANAYQIHRDVFYEFRTWEQFKEAGHIIKIRQAGFDHIRFLFDPGPIVLARHNDDTDSYDAYMKMLLDATGSYLDQNLSVMFNFHPQREDSAPVNWHNTIGDGLENALYVAYRETAAEVGAALAQKWPDGRVCFEPYNEPAPAADHDVPWHERCEDMHAAIRAAAGPDLFIIWGPDTWYGRDRLSQFDPSRFDGQTGWAFHCYEPRLFAYQGYPKLVLNAPYYYIQALEFPPRPERQKPNIDATLARLMADLKQPAGEKALFKTQVVAALNAYYEMPMDAFWLDQTVLAGVADWAKSHGVSVDRIFCNEFGVNRDWPAAWSTAVGEAEPAKGAALEDRVAYTSAFVAALEGRGFRWTCFEWCGADFGITTLDGQFDLLAGMKAALHLGA